MIANRNTGIINLVTMEYIQGKSGKKRAAIACERPHSHILSPSLEIENIMAPHAVNESGGYCGAPIGNDGTRALIGCNGEDSTKGDGTKGNGAEGDYNIVEDDSDDSSGDMDNAAGGSTDDSIDKGNTPEDGSYPRQFWKHHHFATNATTVPKLRRRAFCGDQIRKKSNRPVDRRPPGAAGNLVSGLSLRQVDCYDFQGSDGCFKGRGAKNTDVQGTRKLNPEADKFIPSINKDEAG